MSARKYFLTDGEIRVIRRYYDGKTISTNKIMRRLDHHYPRWYIKRKALEWGLAKCTKMPDWTEKEVTYLHDHLTSAIEKDFPMESTVFYDHGNYERRGRVVMHGSDRVRIVTPSQGVIWIDAYRIKRTFLPPKDFS